MVTPRVWVQTEGHQRVILVHGIVFSHYSTHDRAAEAYAMVTLFESGYADQNDIAHSFRYSTRTLRRYQQRLEAGGLKALAQAQGRPPARSPCPHNSPSATAPSFASRPKKGAIDGLRAGSA
jgi:Helix-turn-helix domain